MDASNQLLALVNDLLEMHRISSERLVLTEEPFGLRQEIAPLLSAWAEDAAQRGLAFTADIEADVPEALWGDPTRIKQILLNLVQNAFNFTEYGAVTVRVSRVADRSDRDATTLLFAVRDTGIGIPPERQVEIFDRFTIGENFLRKRHGRMGLGLSIAKDIVEKMGGVMTRAIAAGGSTIRDYRTPDGVEGGFQHQFAVYGKAGEPCPTCGRKLTAIKVAGRTSTFCPGCQKCV